jgi:tRNA dimethylallyltransferase
MNKNKDKLIVILGQTATGKSDFAVYIAKEIHAEIISADSRQVYKKMNLGTGKITKKEMCRIPHFLLDINHPSKVFTVNDYKKMADKKIYEIIKRDNIPIICGGTGFYIDAIVNGNIFPDVPPNKKLRCELDKKTTQNLFEILKKIDKNRSKNIDKNNRVRLIRAIEIAKELGSVPKIKTIKKFEVLKIGLFLPDDILKERIRTRLLSRVKKGMIKEIKDLHDEGVSWKRLYNFGLEYRYVSLYIQGKLKKEDMIEKLYTEIWHYAKRQKTWFKKDTNTLWIDPRKDTEKKNALNKIKEFLK